MPRGGKDVSLDDVQVMGEWNFTLQSNTPLYWIKSGNLDRYLLRFSAKSPCAPSTFGIVFHAEADGPGTDGASFWVERTKARSGTFSEPPKKRYILAGDGLESKPVITREYEDVEGESKEDFKLLLQGYSGCLFMHDGKVQIKFRLKHQKGSIAFYNTTQNSEANARDDVFFAGVAITALRRGPLEIAGTLARRERGLMQAGSWKDPNEAARAKPTSVADTSEDAAAFSFAAQTTGAGGHFRSSSTQRASDARTSPNAFRATAPSFARSSGATGFAGTSQQSWGSMGGTRGMPKARLRQTASDGVLRKSGAHLSSSMTLTRGGDGWLPLATNAPRREQDLLKEASRRELDKSSCKDFIAM